MRSVGRTVVLAALVLSVLAGSARAQEADAEGDAESAAPAERGNSPEDVEAAREARAYFLSGMRHFEAMRYREAIHDFQLAAERVPSADLWFNIARAHEELSEYALAAEHYRRYLRDRVDPPDRERVEGLIASLEERAEAQREAQRRAPTTGTLVVHAPDGASSVALDGQDLGEGPMDVPLSVDAGAHRYEVTQEGQIPFRAEVTVEPGVSTGAYAQLTPQTEYRSVHGKRRWTWVVGALGAAALGASIGLGAYAVTVNRDGDYDRAKDFARYSDYMLGTGLVLGVTAVILYFIEGRAVETERVQRVAARGLRLTF